MEQIIQKRTELANFFLGQDKKYNKQEILHREFAVLSFSPHEDYIDTVITKYDKLCVNLSTFIPNDTDECYIKGVVADIDRQKYKTIMHIQNKENNISIHMSNYLTDVYAEYLVVGEPIIVKCKIWNEKFFMSFMVALNYLDTNNFDKEQNYMNGASLKFLKKCTQNMENKAYHYGLIKECTQIRTKKGKDMLRGIMYDCGEERSFGCMLTFQNRTLNGVIPQAGDFIKFKSSGDFFINDTEVITYENLKIETQSLHAMSKKI